MDYQNTSFLTLPSLHHPLVYQTEDKENTGAVFSLENTFIFISFSFYVAGVYWVFGLPVMLVLGFFINWYYFFVLIIGFVEIFFPPQDENTPEGGTDFFDTDRLAAAIIDWFLVENRKIFLWQFYSSTCFFSSFIPVFGAAVCVINGVFSWLNEEH